MSVVCERDVSLSEWHKFLQLTYLYCGFCCMHVQISIINGYLRAVSLKASGLACISAVPFARRNAYGCGVPSYPSNHHPTFTYLYTADENVSLE